jgi:hypothetical protein
VTFDEIVKFIQSHFTDGLLLVVGSGLSSAEGMPGMQALADHLKAAAPALTGPDAKLWVDIAAALDAGAGLEAALLKHAPSPTLEVWITAEICKVLLPKEREIVSKVIEGKQTLRLTSFLSSVLKPTTGLPILTPNYERLVEVACEMAGLHVDTTAIGDYAGVFDHRRSFMRSCRGILHRGKTSALDHCPRAIVLKPHGSFDWYKGGSAPLRCSIELDAERLMITPGVIKYKAGYDAPFDKHRDLANEYIDKSARLLVVGYGFNDDHLQTHLVTRVQNGIPTLVLTHTPSAKARELAQNSPNCLCLFQSTKPPGVAILGGSTHLECPGKDLWDLGVLTKELL